MSVDKKSLNSFGLGVAITSLYFMLTGRLCFDWISVVAFIIAIICFVTAHIFYTTENAQKNIGEK